MVSLVWRAERSLETETLQKCRQDQVDLQLIMTGQNELSSSGQCLFQDEKITLRSGPTCGRFDRARDLLFKLGMMLRYTKKLYELLKLIPCLWSDSCFVLSDFFQKSSKMIVISKAWASSFGELREVWKLKLYRNVAKIKSTCN